MYAPPKPPLEDFLRTVNDRGTLEYDPSTPTPTSTPVPTQVPLTTDDDHADHR